MPERALPFAHRASAPPMDADRGSASLELDNHGYVLQALSYTVEETITVGDMTRLVEVSSTVMLTDACVSREFKHGRIDDCSR